MDAEIWPPSLTQTQLPAGRGITDAGNLGMWLAWVQIWTRAMEGGLLLEGEGCQG